MTVAVESPKQTVTHKGFILWFTGLSGSGKSTVSMPVARALKEAGCKVEVLDGDIVRTNLSKGLGFSKEDRDTNIRRIGFVGGLLSRNGVIAITAAISPYRETRDDIRAETTNFIEIFVDCPIEECARRDVKGLYAKAYAGEIENFTGVSDPYEPPVNPEIVLSTREELVEESVHKVLTYLVDRGYVSHMP
ncbi:adenylyl-sulfate kinase [Synechococcus sp. PCC 7336]|uniref:adenylyl-sulfate kinase n=1 Tax=Synechococcus sp. PCC 7336 TaxID=195250 RepID=UPI00034ACE07|nr:adenylyl-sulfate kinase [Synechococcus sp. PCC 7336]